MSFFGRLGGSMPYTKWNELNEDWILNTVKKLSEDWARYHADWEEWKNNTDQAFQDLHDYVMNYFANLDVSEEISEKLNQMAADGSLSALIDPVIVEMIPDLVTAWLNEHITPTSPPVDASLSIAGAAADAKVAGDRLSEVFQNLYKYNSYNFVTTPDATGTSGGVNYKIKNNAITAKGTTTSRFLYNWYFNLEQLPTWLERGKEYTLKVDKVGEAPLTWEIYAYKTLNNYIRLLQSTEGGSFIYPTDEEFRGLMIRATAPGNTYIDTTATPSIREYLSNAELEELTKDYTNIESSVKYLNSVSVYEPLPDGVSEHSGVTYTIEGDYIYFRGNSTAVTQQNIYYDLDALPEWLERGKEYTIDFDAEGGNADLYRVEVFAMISGTEYRLLNRIYKKGKFIYPNDTNYKGLHLRYSAPADYQYGGRIRQALIYDTPTNAELNNKINALENKTYSKYAVRLFKDEFNYYIRANYNTDNDLVYYFQMPYQGYNHTFNLVGMRLIPKDTENTQSAVIQAYNEAQVYKPCGDDFPAITINGNFLGANHGNPNYTRVNLLNHNITISDIGTIWTDNENNNYTLVQVFTTYLVFGSLDNTGNLIIRSPETLTWQSTGITITPDSTDGMQLRRSAINKINNITNEISEDLNDGGMGNNIIIIEEYDIQDQSKALTYLQNNVGNNDNDSYFSDDIPYIMGHLRNIYQFNRNGSITVNVDFTVKENITINRIYGGISGYFNASSTGYENYGLVPNSSNLATKTPINLDDRVNIINATGQIPYRYYQLSNDNHGHFIHLINGLGDTDIVDREQLPITGWFSSTADKLYTVIKENISAQNGDILSWAYGRGAYQANDNTIIITAFDLSDSYIVAIDLSSTFQGYAELPWYMTNKAIEVLEKTNNIEISSTYSTTKGIKLSGSNGAYAVLKLK